MDQDQTFYQQPVDQTPYSAFAWVILLALVITGVVGVGIWRTGSWVKGQHWLRGSQANTISLPSNNAGDDILEQAKAAAANAASNVAQQAANKAAADATQALLNQKDAAIKAASSAAADAAQDQVQQYLGH